MYAVEFAYAIFAFANVIRCGYLLELEKRLANAGSIREHDMPEPCSTSVETAFRAAMWQSGCDAG
jgi:hypothetical protein